MSNFRFQRVDRFPPVVKNLIIINVLVWFAQLAFDKEYQLSNILALWPVQSPEFHPYQIATHMFAHASYDENAHVVFYHILFNMFALFMFGRILENVWGPKRFLFFYFACGVGAAAGHLVMQAVMGTAAPAVGASGAIMGLFVAFAYLFPNTQVIFLFLPVPIKAKWMALIFIGLDLFGGLGNVAGDNLAHFAHLGGALTGFLIVFFWNKTNRKTLY